MDIVHLCVYACIDTCVVTILLCNNARVPSNVWLRRVHLHRCACWAFVCARCLGYAYVRHTAGSTACGAIRCVACGVIVAAHDSG